MSSVLLWAKTSAGGATVLASSYTASADIPWGGRSVGGLKVSSRVSLELHGVIDGATNFVVKVTRKPVTVPADTAMGAVDLATTSHKEGIAGLPQPIGEHTYTANFDDVVEFDLSDAPATLNVNVKCAGTIGTNTALRAYLRWL